MTLDDAWLAIHWAAADAIGFSFTVNSPRISGWMRGAVSSHAMAGDGGYDDEDVCDKWRHSRVCVEWMANVISNGTVEVSNFTPEMLVLWDYILENFPPRSSNG